MKKHFLILLVIFLMTGIVLSGCAKSTPTPAPTPVPAPAPKPAPAPGPAQAEIIELSLAHFEPPVTGSAKLYQAWANKVMEKAQGKVEITVYPAQSLSSIRDMWASVTGGVADMGVFSMGEEAKHMQLNDILKQASAHIPDGTVGLRIWEELMATFPEMREEFKEIKLLFYGTTSAAQVHTIDKAVHVPGDIRNMKIVCPPGGAEIEFTRLAGASPIGLPATEWYMSLERGMAEGLMVPYQAVQIFGCSELLKYHVQPNYGPNLLFAGMNIAKWNSLPPDIQKVFEDLKTPTTEELTSLKENEEIQIKGKFKELGHTFIELTTEEHALWDTAVTSQSDKWIKETEALGKPAGKVYEEAVRLVEKYRQ